MKKIYLMKNPDIFQGEKFLVCGSDDVRYFEGWYFKNICYDFGVSFIPGISINDKERKAFIQIITNDSSYFIDYDINDFQYNYDPFWIEIGNNFFSKERVRIDIKDEELGLVLCGDLKYSESRNINTTFFSPNIMGIFSYIPFMECNHAILSMQNKVNGVISINGERYSFFNGSGYIEKDFGCSFPKYYVWGQGNNFKNSSSSLMFSIADIPFKLFNFRGLICSLIVNDKEYRFATYNGSRILKYEVNDWGVYIIVKKGKYTLEIKCNYNDSLMLKAPFEGKMNKDIFESIAASISVVLKKRKKVIFSDISSNCGLEVVI